MTPLIVASPAMVAHRSGMALSLAGGITSAPINAKIAGANVPVLILATLFVRWLWKAGFHTCVCGYGNLWDPHWRLWLFKPPW